VVDQRILELDTRRRRVIAKHRQQIAAVGIVMSIGVAMMAGGGVLAGLNAKGTESTDPDYDPAAESKRKKLLTGGIALAIYGLLVVGVSFVPLAKAVQSRRQLEGLALGRTRLHLTGGGATLRF